MRQSEKILLTFLLLGIVSLGSFISWKYYHNSSSSNTTKNSSGAAVTSATPSRYEILDVSPNPFYEPTVGKNSVKKLSLPTKPSETTNKPVANENFNTNRESLPPSPLSASGNTNTFVSPTAPAAVSNQNVNSVPHPTAVNEKSFSFAVLGDTQEFDKTDLKGALQRAVANVAKENVDLVMTVGDLVSSCDSDECPGKFKDWKSIMSSLLNKTKEVRGNHDRSKRESSDKIWQEVFELPANGPEEFSELVYSFDQENSHFIVLDSEKPEEHLINKEQRDWLEKDLSENTKENTFVFFHEPAYPVSSKKNESLDVNKENRDALWEILKKYSVTAVFSGHEHIMSRRNVDGIYQFIVGNTDTFDHDSPKPGVAEYAYRGHHYAIVTVKGSDVTIKIFNVDGKELNSFVLP